MTGFVATEGVLNKVLYKNCQLKFSLFRFTKLERILFYDCLLNESDFYSAGLKQVDFYKCDLNKSEMSKTEHFKTDLRTSNISGLNISPESLKGVTISRTQVFDLAWLLGANIKEDFL
jgi:uncharacterized protein YjbI with pentapeptide repeats